MAAAKAGVLQNDLSGTYPRAQEIPFDSDRKRMVTIHQIEDVIPEDSSPIYDEQKHEWYAVAVKGAPDIVLSLCSYYQTIQDDTRADG